MRKDFILVTIIGFLVGALVLMPLKTLGFDLKIWLILLSIFGFTIFAPIAFWVLQKLNYEC